MKMKASYLKERRKHPRIKKPFPITLKIEDADFVTETKNISLGGAYCHIDKYIKLLTRLSICIGLSHTQDNVYCKGVVVRVDEAVPTGYNIAIFFNEMSEENRQRLSQYIKRHISQNN